MSTPLSENHAERYLVLNLGATRLLLEPAEVRDIEAAEQVSVVDAPPGATGSMAINGRSFPVYDLTPSFDLRFDAPLAGRLCVLLEHPSDPMVVLCEKVDMLEVTDRLHPLPAAMRLVNSPIKALALRSDGLVCLSSAALLVACVQYGIQQVPAAATPGVQA